MLQNATLEGGRGLDQGYALERMSNIPVDEPGCREYLDYKVISFLHQTANACMSIVQCLLHKFPIRRH